MLELRKTARWATTLGFAAAVVMGAGSAMAQETSVLMMPKIVGVPYYNAVKLGVDEASKELADSTSVIWQGPTVDQVDKQIEMIDNALAAQPSVIAVASNDPAAIVPVLKKAKDAGTHVMTWDGDAEFREVFVNFVNYDDFGAQLVEEMVKQVGETADVAVVTSTLTAPNQSAWLEAMRKRIAEKHPGINIVDVRQSQEDQQLAFQQTQDLLKSRPDLKGIFAITTVALPGAAEAVKQMGLTGKVAVVGNSTPNVIRPYLKEGVIKSAVLWNPSDHGYLTVYVARALAKGEIKLDQEFDAGRLGKFKPFADSRGLQVLLGAPLVFTTENIDKFDF
ncbi:MAG: substrate-binding domain-containing protein [Rhizobiaceae bacterium]|nr:substrate-binding domain-containing protein [Rhizobiaceae bacterium]